jgi:adenylate kinase
MKLIMLGPPGSGKGTYASRMVPKLGIPAISTGEMFRENIRNNTETGKIAKAYMDRGELAPDELTVKMLKERIAKADAKKGFILDGFPRTIPQADALGKITKIDFVVNLVVPDKIVIARLSSRRQCRKCSKIYNVLFLKSKVEGICDVCGGELYQRDDDKPATIKERLVVYQKNTQPLIDYYRKKKLVIDIPCNSVDIPPEIMVDKIMKELGTAHISGKTQ